MIDNIDLNHEVLHYLFLNYNIIIIIILSM